MSTHGGRRRGAGRPRGSGRFGGEPTVVVRIPQALKQQTLAAARRYRADERREGFEKPEPQMRSNRIYRFATTVPAGSGAAFEETATETVDLHEHLVRHPESTALYSVLGDSMDLAGIFEHDEILIDRSRQPIAGDIVLAVVPQEGQTLKRLAVQQGRHLLVPQSSNSAHQAVPVDEATGAQVTGVAVALLRKL